MSCFADVLDRIDAANAADPERVTDGGVERPAALVYGRRMSAELVEATTAPGRSKRKSANPIDLLPLQPSTTSARFSAARRARVSDRRMTLNSGLPLGPRMRRARW